MRGMGWRREKQRNGIEKDKIEEMAGCEAETVYQMNRYVKVDGIGDRSEERLDERQN